MFTDLNSIESLETPLFSGFDFCIIGAGAAGITLANKLGKEGFKIALLESGDFEPGDAQFMAEGTSSGIDYMQLYGSRLRYFGGTTGHWAGQSASLDEFDFLTREWVPDSGWPITFKEFIQYQPEAADLCGVPQGGFHWADIQHTEKLDLPFSRKIFDDLSMRYSHPPRRFGEYFRDEVAASKNIICFLNANVTELISDNNENNIISVNIETLSNKQFNLKAKNFIIASGGIENSRLLLASNKINAKGLGNSNDMVGRFFMEHPNFDTSLITITDEKNAQYLMSPTLNRGSVKNRLDFQLNKEQQQQLKILNHSAFFVNTNIKRDHMEESIDYMDKVWRKAESLYGRFFDKPKEKVTQRQFKLRIRLEQAPIANSRVTLSNETDELGKPQANINLKFGPSEGKTIDELLKAVAKHLGINSIGRMKIEFDNANDDWKNQLGWQVHHCGGTRMSETPKKGVVDTNCKVHGINNLWIAGSSVFPTSGHTNPTMNLLTLSLRLSDHLINRV
jgi:choline dehydrogenase-like flavoprotein